MLRRTRTLHVVASALAAVSLAACSAGTADPAGSMAPAEQIKTTRLGFSRT